MIVDQAISPVMFLSYSSRDRGFADRLANDLARSGVTVWYDQWSMAPGDRLREKINRGIETCRFFGVIISRRSLASAWLQHELDAAMIRFLEKKSVRILPILFGQLRAEEIPVDLRGLLYLDFRYLTEERYRTQLDRLVRLVTSSFEYPEPPPISNNLVGPSGLPLADELIAYAVEERDEPLPAEQLTSDWPLDYCRGNRTALLQAVNRLVYDNYGSKRVERLLHLFHGIFELHKIKLHQMPNQLLRIIDDPDYDSNTRAIAIHIVGRLDFPLGETRLERLLAAGPNPVVYSLCEYLEFRVGLVDSEALARKLLAIVNRPDYLSYFVANNAETGEEEDADVRYFAARCLALAELDPVVEELVVATLRQNYPEIEDESFSLSLNSFVLGAVERGGSRLWKRYSGGLGSVFDRHPRKGEIRIGKGDATHNPAGRADGNRKQRGSRRSPA